MDAANYDDWASFADAYLSAAKILGTGGRNADFYFGLGPFSQTLGLASELTIKAMLLKLGYDPTKIREFGHDLEKLHSEINKDCSDKIERICTEVAVYIRFNGVSVPQEFSDFAKSNDRNPLEYYLLSTQLKALNYNYHNDRDDGAKFRTRYPDPEKRFRSFNADVIFFNMIEIRALSDAL
ncbi:hypothetical protein [Salibaculum halophilum]|uniref:hypothetical protein n=1 Tax=Salibaculum halophilum TaxID=1914408 RepID=UPI00117A24AB|nr:hypothetical protein [Salibaculum halophilum]